MLLALVFYTWAVLSDMRQGLHRKHLIIFGAGLICDFLRWFPMNLIATAYGKPPAWHSISGITSCPGWHFIFFWL